MPAPTERRSARTCARSSCTARASGRIETLRGNDIRFDYRHTSFAPEDVMLRVQLELPSKPYQGDSGAAFAYVIEKRRASQPLNQKSAGCIFKNPAGRFGRAHD